MKNFRLDSWHWFLLFAGLALFCRLFLGLGDERFDQWMQWGLLIPIFYILQEIKEKL
jgi:hypothetical protein